MTSKKITRIALLTSLALIFQSLRFFIPIPVFLSTFVIGSLVNAVLLVAVGTVGFGAGAFIVVVTPIVAYFQQILPLPVFIVPVALGNLIYISVFKAVSKWGKWQGILLGAAGKTCFLFFVFKWMLGFILVNAKIAAGIMFVMSWPQLLTGILGGILFVLIANRIKPVL